MGRKYDAPASRNVLKDSVKRVEAMLDDPIAAKALRGKQSILKSYKRDKELLEKGTPPDVVPDERAKLEQRSHQLEDAMIHGDKSLNIDPMCTNRAMWENPAGAIGQHGRWEKHWLAYTLSPDGTKVVKSSDGRGAIDEWKDLQRVLHKDREEEDPDIGNIERFRPDYAEAVTDYRSRSFAPGAALTRAQYDDVFPDHEPTDVEKKLRSYEEELAKLKAEIAEFTENESKLQSEDGDPTGVIPPSPAARQCIATVKKTGVRCRAMAIKDSNYCCFHDPNRGKK